MERTVGLVSLGCSKNRVDSEVMLGILTQHGYRVVANPEEADVILVNTCGFIQSAKEESIDAILDMARYKNGGRLKKLIVTGCLSQRYGKEIRDDMPEVDAILTGHTHMNYAWSAPVPGTGRTRPVLQTGSYGDRVGKIVLQADDATGEVSSFTVENVARGAAPTDADLATYPRVAQVKTIVDNAVAYADQIGRQPIGSVTADITTAFSGGSYVEGRYTGAANSSSRAALVTGKASKKETIASLDQFFKQRSEKRDYILIRGLE